MCARGPLTGAGVWKVQQKQTGSFWSTNSRPKQFAIKQAAIKSPDDPDKNYSPLNEIDIMLQLSNKARIVHLYDNWQHGDYVYMKYELCDFSLAQVFNVKGFELSGRDKAE
ncbi:unnamed protein product [Medioppia subpectinata]|uniref:Protein kinase domain-containing protein n=1 Tax=Medioppia subpectinata TaxID=1979941 RepID=A0A7R9KVI6_9ACAR|nr:unnamed protein product [Medioppia subpectinata]CAG2109268.1 unnamed protein product [Medioppia subpectinata]